MFWSGGVLTLKDERRFGLAALVSHLDLFEEKQSLSTHFMAYICWLVAAKAENRLWC